MSMPRLGTRSLPAIAARGIAVPSYDRRGMMPAVVHLGLGAFQRAHAAIVFDDLMNRAPAAHPGAWGVFGVAMRQPGLIQAIDAQDGLYSVRAADADGAVVRVVGALAATGVAAQAPARIVDVIGAEATRWVTLTITEKGYGWHAAGGGPDLSHPTFGADWADPAAPPRSAVGLIVAALALRRARCLPGLTIASCDNLAGNGGKLQHLCFELARRRDPALADWIATGCTFPSSMVDRIVPQAGAAECDHAASVLGADDEAAVGCERFGEWVIEDHFAAPCDDLRALAASSPDAPASIRLRIVADVAPFEQAKLRLLNGSHSAIAYLGASAGIETISEAIVQPAFTGFVTGLMAEELAPGLTRPDIDGYCRELMARFSNPSLRHRTHQVAADGSQKIAQRWAPVLAERFATGLPVPRLAFAAAAWMRYLRGRDDLGHEHRIDDPMAQVLRATIDAAGPAPAAIVPALLGVRVIWGDAPAANPAFVAQVVRWFEALDRDGIATTLAEFNRTAIRR